MQITSRSYNYATHEYENWGVDDTGKEGLLSVGEIQLELVFPDPVPLKPPKIVDMSADACGCPSCTG